MHVSLPHHFTFASDGPDVCASIIEILNSTDLTLKSSNFSIYNESNSSGQLVYKPINNIGLFIASSINLACSIELEKGGGAHLHIAQPMQTLIYAV